MNPTTLSKFVKAMRKQYNLTQVELSEKSGVGLRFARELTHLFPKNARMPEKPRPHVARAPA